MKKVLILGHRGMLGNTTYSYLSQFYTVDTIEYRWPSNEFRAYIETYKGDFIINCIGAIPQKTAVYDINCILPVYLSKYSSCKVVHPGTDCESDSTPYGISKAIATDLILQYGVSTKIIKASVIGIETSTSDSLLCWALKQQGTVQGYLDAKWNGITTLEWAKQCHNLLSDWDSYTQLTTYTTACISKYNLLTVIKKIYNLQFEIEPVQGRGVDKCLQGHRLSDIEKQLKELKAFYER